MTEKWCVCRTADSEALKDKERRQVLRRDFVYSCAYCTMTECEALGVGFHIDHYEPRKARPDLERVYSNLMYACQQCNNLKGDIVVPEPAKLQGYRFFKADEDDPRDHFELIRDRLTALTNVGRLTVNLLNLNGVNRRRLRKIRRELYGSDDVILGGLARLKGLTLDQLPKRGRAELARSLPELTARLELTQAAIDRELVGRFAMSPLLDVVDETSGRRSFLESIDAVTPWYARKSGLSVEGKSSPKPVLPVGAAPKKKSARKRR